MQKHTFALSVIAALVLALPSVGMSQSKKDVKSETDMPRYSYPLTESASDLVQADDATFKQFSGQVAKNLDKTSAEYDIHDRATLREQLGERLNLQLLNNDNQGALETIKALREAQDKPDARLTAGIIAESIVKARMDTQETSGPAFDAALAKEFGKLIDPLPWAVVGDTMKQMHTGFEVVTKAFVIGNIQHELDPKVAKTGTLDNEGAQAVVSARLRINVLIPEIAALDPVLTRYIAAHNVQKPDIWPAREVTLTADEKLTPVNVAIWDSGVDTSLYPNNLFTDPNPGNHSPHGLAVGLHGEIEKGDLQPETDRERQDYPGMLKILQGLNDLTNQIDSPDAQAAKEFTRKTPPDQMPLVVEELRFYGQWMHGTHVAGIAIRGNPAAHLVVARFNDTLPEYPFAPTLAWAHKMADNFAMFGDYFRVHNVRVVNMSWGDDVAEFETWMSKTSKERDPAKRKAEADEIYQVWKSGIQRAMRNAPNTLFVAAAGNSDSNASFLEDVPASLKEPNLITVGAVDQAGEETSFTSYGDTVVVDADGFQVDSLVPGGTHLRESGTSMASPNVANLAAKLFALDPDLTPEEVIALIKAGADNSPDGRRHNINPKATVALLPNPHE